LVDNFTLIRNSHNFKFGGEYRRAIVNSFNDTLARGRLNFNSLADFLAGIVSPTNTARITGDTRRDTFTNNFGLFFQDDWRVRRDLTITYGIRYEYLGVLSENDDRLSNFSPDKGLVQVGTSQLDQLYQSDRNNFAPRIGLAYDVNNRGRLILRAGYGIYFDTPSQDYFLAQGFDSPSVGNNPIANLGINTISFAPGTAIPFGVNVPIFDPNRALGLRATPLLAVDQRLRTPYVQNYNFNIQYLLGANSVLQTGYVGSIGTRLFRIRDINQPTPGPAASRQGRRPFFNQFPQFGAINYLETTANSNYHALQLSFRQRVASLTLFAAYTYSKSIDDASNGIFSGTAGIAFPQNSHNLRAERALSSFDSRNRFTANFVYDANILPLLLAALPQVLTTGWQFTGTVTFSGGVPITPFLPFDNSGTGNLNDRPNLVSAPQRQAPGNVTAFFNTAAFALPAPGTFGNAGRNIIIGPNFITTDFAVNKRTKITERLSLQFRGEIFNIFNRPNFSLPNVQFTSPAFGTIGETLDVTAGNPRLGEGGPRTIQLGLKFIF
jgi:hypothetical protein